MLSHSGKEHSICLEVRSLERFPTLFWRWVDYRAIPVILRNAAALLSCNNPAVLHHPFVQNWRGKKRESCRWRWRAAWHPWLTRLPWRKTGEWVCEGVRGQDRGCHSLSHAHAPKKKNPTTQKCRLSLYHPSQSSSSLISVHPGMQTSQQDSVSWSGSFTTDSRCGWNCLLLLVHLSVVLLMCGGQISTWVVLAQITRYRKW